MIKVGVHMVHKAHSPYLWLMTSLNVGYVRNIRNYRFVYSYSGSIEINRGILVDQGFKTCSSCFPLQRFRSKLSVQVYSITQDYLNYFSSHSELTLTMLSTQ